MRKDGFASRVSLLSMCVIHRKRLVPMMLLSTIEQPEGLITRGKSCLVQARYVKFVPSATAIHAV